MSWYAKHFGDGRIRLSPHGGLQDLKGVFEAFAKTRPGAAMFCQVDDDGSATIYLTPEAAEFAAMIRATESAPPPPNDQVILLVG